MSTTAMAQPPVRTSMPPWWARRRFILLMSVIVVPISLTAIFNSYGALTSESAMRMAFASVAGTTIALIGAVVALILTITHRRNLAGVVFFALVLLCVIAQAIVTMESAGTLLIERLATIAEVDRLSD